MLEISCIELPKKLTYSNSVLKYTYTEKNYKIEFYNYYNEEEKRYNTNIYITDKKEFIYFIDIEVINDYKWLDSIKDSIIYTEKIIQEVRKKLERKW